MPGSIIAVQVFGLIAGSFAAAATAFAINMIASSIIARAFGPKGAGDSANTSSNPGNNQQVGPAGDNKVPVIYGTAFAGGIITDLSITNDNQTIYYVLTLAEVTGSEYGAADTYTFGNVYFGGKRCVFDGTDASKVVGLLDESTGQTQTNIDGKLNIYLYRNGSSSGTNTSLTAIQVMQDEGLVYKWDSSKQMTNAAFAILKMQYSVSANLTGIQQTRFQLTNSRTNPGACLYDFMRSERYGAALTDEQIDSVSLNALDAYSEQTMTYTTYTGGSATQQRFKFDGLLDMNNTVMTNFQTLSTCCDCLIKYNEINGKWGVIVQQPTYTAVMDINDSNMVSSIQVTPIDLASSYNIIEVKFPDGSSKDTFNSATFDLSVVNPSLMYPNEPVNKQTVSLPLVNNSVRAQYIANRCLEAVREDLQLKVTVNYVGIQLEAGDIVTVTNANYGWAAKVFRITQVVENFTDDGQVTASLTLGEYNPAVYDDINVTQFTPAPNTGIGSPLTFGTLYAPTFTNIQVNAAIPSFDVAVICSSSGIVQYAEVYYSAFQYPTAEQLLFAGTTAINSNGNPYTPNASMGTVQISTVPQGNWYFFVRYVNALGSSPFSSASAVFAWRPTTYQYTNRWIAVAYATNATGTTGFSFNPRGKTYFGLLNATTANTSNDPTQYTWYDGNFGTENYLLFASRGERKVSIAVGNAGFSNLGGAFVPSETSVYDTSVWGALEDGQNYIDLDARSGQLTKAGTTAISSADGLLSVSNNTNGSMIVSLQKFLNFGNGVYSKTFNAATLTIDVYGRVVGFTEPDSFYYTDNTFTATAGQTSFAVTHVVGNVLVFRDGILMDTSEYTETTTTVVLNVACAAGEIVEIINMRAVSTNQYYEPLTTSIASSTSTTVTYLAGPDQIIEVGDQLCFAATQPDPTDTVTSFAVSAVNASTKVITFGTTISGATAGLQIFRKRAAGAAYRPFSRWTVDLTAANSYTPTQFAVRNGFESIYINGAQLNEVDYDLTGTTLDGFPSPLTGKLTVIAYSENNFGVPASNVTNTVVYSAAGVLSYVFPNNPLSMEVYANGVLLSKGASADYTATSGGYNLVTAFNNNFTLLNQQTFARIGAA